MSVCQSAKTKWWILLNQKQNRVHRLSFMIRPVRTYSLSPAFIVYWVTIMLVENDRILHDQYRGSLMTSYVACLSHTERLRGRGRRPPGDGWSVTLGGTQHALTALFRYELMDAHIELIKRWYIAKRINIRRTELIVQRLYTCLS